MNFNWTVTDRDVGALKACVLEAKRRGDEYVRYREETNVTGPPPVFSRERFWLSLISGLLTSQQRSTRGSPVSNLMEETSFPLTLEVLARYSDAEAFAHEFLTARGGIRFTNKIPRRMKSGLAWLDSGGWAKVEEYFVQLLGTRSSEPNATHIPVERGAAHFIDVQFEGFGPKQARNLWQDLGLTRFETPLDRRVGRWMNDHLSCKIEIDQLGDEVYYCGVLDYLQAICQKAGVLPCVFDAAAFDNDNLAQTAPLATTNRLAGKTTVVGFVNQNGQITIRNTGLLGTDHLQYVYQLSCSHCGHNYGVNGSDIHDRKCPECQGGAAGLDYLKEGAHA